MNVRIGIVTLPYNQDTRGVGSGKGPEVILASGLMEELRGQGDDVIGPFVAELTDEDQKERGGWKAVGLHGRHLKERVAETLGQGAFLLVLEGDCNASIGVIAGLKQYGERHRMPRVGMAWIDAHGDINTPETSLSGMLGGMPVAVSLGWCLPRIRDDIGMTPLSADYLVLMALRDVDPLERDLIDRVAIAEVTEQEVRERSERFHITMQQLSDRIDLLYVHVDLDVLDPVESPGMGLPAPHGLTSVELAEALTVILRGPKVVALGIASYGQDRDPDRRGLASVKRLIHAGMAGLRARGSRSSL